MKDIKREENKNSTAHECCSSRRQIGFHRKDMCDRYCSECMGFCCCSSVNIKKRGFEGRQIKVTFL